jgi:hypothetical protein
MDRFARNYLIALLAVLVFAVSWYYLSRDGRVAEINTMLARDTQLSSYPYLFQVRSLEDGIATMGSPRSARVPVMQFLRTAFPALGNTAVDHPDMFAAQAVLVEKQTRAAELVQSQPDVTSVRWVLDERWYNEHGVFLDLQP